MSKTFSPHLLLLSSLATSLAAQTPLAPYTPPMVERVWADKDLYPGDFGPMVRTQITNFGYPDAVFLSGTHVMLMKAPALLFQIEPLAGTVGFAATGLCAIEDSASPFSLAIPGADGLGLWRPSSGTLVQIQVASWASATDVQQVRGSDAVVGRGADGETIVRADLVAASELEPWTVPGLLAIVPFDYDGDGADEIGIVCEDRVEIRRMNGTVLDTYAAHLTAAEAARSPTPVGDSLTILCKVHGHGRQWLASIHRIWQGASPLGTADSVGLTVADADDNGWHDAMTMSTTGPSFDAVLCLGAFQVPWFEYGSQGGFEVLLPATTPTISNPASPLMTDNNGDGRTDTILAKQGQGAFAFGESPFSPGYVAEVRYSAVNVVGVHASGEPSPHDTAHINLSLIHDNVPSTATHLEMHVYLWDALGGGDPLYRSGWGASVAFTPSAAPYNIASGTFLASEISSQAIVFVLRYARQENGVTTHVWGPHVGAVTVSDAVNAHLQSLPGIFADQAAIGGVPTGGVTVITQIPPVRPPTGFDGDGDGGGD